MLLLTQTVLAVIAVTCTTAFVSKGRYNHINYSDVPCIVKHVMHVYVFFCVWHLVYAAAKSQVQSLKDVTNDNIDGNLELRTAGLMGETNDIVSDPISSSEVEGDYVGELLSSDTYKSEGIHDNIYYYVLGLNLHFIYAGDRDTRPPPACISCSR